MLWWLTKEIYIPKGTFLICMNFYKDELGLVQWQIRESLLQLYVLMPLSKLLPLKLISLTSSVCTYWSTQAALLSAHKHAMLIGASLPWLISSFTCMVLPLSLGFSPHVLLVSVFNTLFPLPESLFLPSWVVLPQTYLRYLWLQVA